MHMADLWSRCRKVQCPACRTGLLEPLETEVYECPTCFTYLKAKGAQSNSSNQASSVIHTQAQEQDLSLDERKEDMPRNESISNQEQNETELAEDSQIQWYSATSVANSSTSYFPSRDSSGKNVTSASNEGELTGEAEVSRDRLMQQDSLEDKAGTHLSLRGEASGDGFISECVSVENTENKDVKERATLGINCSMPSTCAGKIVLTGECAGVEETYQRGRQEEGNNTNGKKEQKFESEIIRDKDSELSFKYIASSLKSNFHLEEKKRTHRLAKLSSEASGKEDELTATAGLSLELPTSNQESLDDYESYSTLSEFPLQHGSDLEFDFPALSADSMHSAKLSETLFKPKTPEGPHQLEWQDADCYSAISTFQTSKSSTVSSIGFVGGIASNVMAQVLAKKKDKESCNKVPVPGAISGESHCVDKKGFIVDLPKDHKLNLHGESKDKLLETSKIGAEQFLQRNSLSIVRGHMQSSGTDASSSTLLEDRNMKTCLTVEEDTKVIKSVATLVLKDANTSSLPDNGLGTLHCIKRRETQAAGPIVTTGGDAETAHYDLRKKSDSGVVQLSNVTRQINMPQSGIKSEGHYQQDYLGKEVQFHKRVEVIKMSDLNAKQKHKRSYSSDAAQLLNSQDVASSSGTYQHDGNIHNEDAYMSAARTLEGSLRAHEGHARAARILAGQSLQLQSPEEDLYLVGQPIHEVDAPKFFPAGSQFFGSNVNFDGSRPFTHTMCSYQAPSHPLMFGHVYSCHGCHPGGPICMPYVHGKHSLVPHLPMQSCLICLRTIGHYQGHTELGYFQQGFQVQAPCMLCHSPTCFSPQIAHTHETSMAAATPFVSSVAKKPKHYPPLPQGRMVPYVACTGCNDILEVPKYLSVSGETQKLCCGGCGKVSKFTVLKNIKKSYSVGLQSSAVGSTRKAFLSSPPSFEFMVRNREIPVSGVGQRQSSESSHGKSLHLKNQWGSLSSRHYTGSGHHSLQGELVKSSQDEPNAKFSTGITNQSSQDEFFFRSLSRKSELDSSRSLFRGFKTMSARFGVNNGYNDSVVGSDDVPLQCTVDEKEEGLDFGAPRPSDGESLDQRSPESRMRSPEKFELVDQPWQRNSFGIEEACRATEIQEDFGSERINIAQERSSTSLFTLLNQESMKFEINLEKRVPYEEWTTALWSPGLRSPVHDHTNQSSTSRAREIGRARNLRAPQFVKKGQRYIASMLTRSLKH